MRQIAALAAMILMLSCPVWSLSFSGSGGISFGLSGSLTLKGTAEPPPSIWLNATMTSNTEPSPNACSNSESMMNAYLAFDHSYVNWMEVGYAMEGTVGWVKFDFGSGVTQVCNKIVLSNVSTMGIKDWTFAGSNNDSTWTSLGTGTAADSGDRQSFAISNTTAYRYYRLTAESTHDTGGMGTWITEVELRNE